MSTVDYLPVATGVGANVESQGTFAGSGHQTSGFSAGLAQSAQVNKCLRQSSMIAAAIANLISQRLGISVLDDGNLTTLITNLIAAITPTVVLKKGTGLGNYTTTSTSYIKVDATNLQYTVTIPVGYQLAIIANGDWFVPDTSGTSRNAALFDGVTQLVTRTISLAITGGVSWGMTWTIIGDGASHTISLQFETGNVANSAQIQNGSLGVVPTMLFMLTPSN